MVDISSRWHISGCSVQGAKHLRNNKPNQDAIHWNKHSQSLCLSIGDGHGQNASFRSHIGSKIAVHISLEICQKLSQKSLLNHFPETLLTHWQKQVLKHIQEYPFNAQELQQIETMENQFITYGTTLITAFLMDDICYFFQLGDGDILLISDQGEVSRAMIQDQRLLANETTSLCQSDAVQNFRTSSIHLSQNQIAIILLATDGYSNSFQKEHDFLKVGKDLFDLLRIDGLQKVEKNLDHWLREASDTGSGDDITLGLICREDVIQSEIW